MKSKKWPSALFTEEEVVKLFVIGVCIGAVLMFFYLQS